MSGKMTTYPYPVKELLITSNTSNLHRGISMIFQDDAIPLPASLAGKIKSAEFYFEEISYWGSDKPSSSDNCVPDKRSIPNPINWYPKSNNVLKTNFCNKLNYRGPARLKFLDPRTSEELIKYATYFYNAAVKIGIEFKSAIGEINRYREQYADRIKYKQDPDVDIARFDMGKHINFNPTEYSSGTSVTRKSGDHQITETSLSSGSTRKIITDRVTQYNEMLNKMENEIDFFKIAFSEKDINNNVNIWLTAQMYYGSPYRSYDRTSSLKVNELVKDVFVSRINEAKKLAYAQAR